METTQPSHDTLDRRNAIQRPTTRRQLQSRWMAIGAVVALMCIGLQACSLPGPGPTTNDVTVPSVTPVPNPPHHNFATVQYCIDSTGSYPQKQFDEANNYMANSISAGIQANEAGFNVYVTYINGNPVDPSSTPLIFKVPAIDAYPTPPPTLPTPTAGDGGFDNAAAKAEATATEQTAQWYQNYPSQDATVTAQINAEKQSIASDLTMLRNLPRLKSATSVWGCLYEASERFANAPSGDKWLVIASDLKDNIPVDITKVNFQGVKIRVIDFYCAGGPNSCQNTQNQWTPVFEQAGAAQGDIRFYQSADTDTHPLLFSGNA